VTPSDRLSFDLTMFTSYYDHLQTNEVVVPFPPVSTNGNKANAKTYGVELSSSWQVLDFWRLYGAFTLLRMNFSADSDSTDTGVKGQDRNDPRGQVFLRSSFDLGSSVSADVMGRYVGSQPSNGVERYYDMDARIAWRATHGLELSAVGQNLLHPHHFESANTAIGEQATQVERGVYFMVRLDF
jgi:iron complex outermembrane receptor protein